LDVIGTVGGLIVSAIALAVAAFGLRVADGTLKLAREERAAGHREALYARQVDAAIDIAAVMVPFTGRAIGQITLAQVAQVVATHGGPEPLSNDDANAVRSACLADLQRFQDVSQRYAVVLTQDAAATVAQVVSTFLDITADRRLDTGYSADRTPRRDPDPAALLSKATTQAMNTLRDSISTDRLAAQTLDRILRTTPGADGKHS